MSSTQVDDRSLHVSGDEVAAGLRRLTQRITETGVGEMAGGLLGGEFGYGAHVDKAVLILRPYC
jgi:hypothetical protein